MTGPDREAVLEVRNLRKTFVRGPERVHALRDVSFALRPGELVGLTGRSGSGKTTLLNVLCGWERPDEGSISLGGKALANPAALRWSQIAIVTQDLALFEELTIGDNVRLPIRLGDATASRDDTDALMDELGILHLAPRLPLEASLGEQQRAALARGIVSEPQVLLADEPTGHQDEGWTKAVMTALRSLAARGTACLVATHDPDALEFLDRTLAMADGSLEPVTP